MTAPIVTPKYDGTVPIPPKPEVVAGRNIPYRGMQNHGVPVTQNFPEMEDHSEDDAPELEESPATSEPFPVKIVTAASEEIRSFVIRREYVSASSGRIIPRLRSRITARIANLSGETIYVGPNSSVQVFTGFPIATNGYLDTVTEDEVWAVSSSGNSAEIAVFDQYAIAER